MFEQAEKNKKVISRNDPIISMQHANADEDTYTGNRGKYKSRIGGTIGSKEQEKANEDLMNNQASQDYASYMNAKYPASASSLQEQQAKEAAKNEYASDKLKYSASESQMTSQFGKKFIKEKQAQQNERKTFKINTQIKKDSNTEAVSSTLSACQSQMQ